MKIRNAMATGTILLVAMFVVAACGPAATEEEAQQLTREAASSETETAAGADEPVHETADEAPELEVAEGELTSTESGLQYIETREGDGRRPEEGDMVTMNIVGSLDDGTVFADTYSDGTPIVATLTDEDLLPGWKEGVLLMKVGGQARLVMPPELAFGAEGAGGIIPPSSTVTIDVELIDAVSPPKPPDVAESDLATTESGLRYFDLVEGSGDVPVEGQDVVVNYTAWLQDTGGFIASSEAQGQPLTFTLGSDLGVFPGWDEGVSTMQIGGRRYLVIPPELALGDAGGGRIPPNAFIVMEVELIDALPLLLPTEISEGDFTETDSGLKYFDMVEGSGDAAETGQLVTVDYTGWLLDGAKFDSSLDRGVPFTFELGTGAVIQGWDEGVAGMKPGGKRQLVIPAELAYGDAGAGANIPPGATLLFEVELISAEDSGQ